MIDPRDEWFLEIFRWTQENNIEITLPRRGGPRFRKRPPKTRAPVAPVKGDDDNGMGN